jgi:hypothetical protein
MIPMTQDQYSQAREPGYVARGDAIPDDETEDYPTEESRPMTRFQRVASALRGGGPEQDELDETAQAADPEAPAVPVAVAPAMANSPVSREARRQGDYWDEPGASASHRDEAAAVTSPDVSVPAGVSGAASVTGQAGEDADHPPTQPDMFGTATHAGNGATSEPYPEAQAGRHAAGASAPAGAPAGASAPAESRPGEAAGMLGDFSDLTYGNLIPDAAVYIEQWQRVQFKFVDDPHASVTEAADIVAQVTAKMEAAIQERQRAIEDRQRAIADQQRSLRDRWGEGTNADTEALRATLRLYKTFLDQLVGPRAG